MFIYFILLHERSPLGILRFYVLRVELKSFRWYYKDLVVLVVYILFLILSPRRLVIFLPISVEIISKNS